MPVHYSIPGIELNLMSPGLPENFKGIKINGSEQCYIIDNFGQTVNQSVATNQVSLNIQSIDWHSPTTIKCHYELLPGLYTRILLDKRIVEHTRGVGPASLKGGQFTSFFGSNFTTAVLPEESGEYTSVGLWWSTGFIRDIIAGNVRLHMEMDALTDGFPTKIIAPPLELTTDMHDVLNELLGFNYTGPGVNKFLHEKMKKLGRLVIKESVELTSIKKQFTENAWERLTQGLNFIIADPIKNITAETLGAQIGVSATLLRKGIKARTGYSFSEFCRNIMLIHAGRKILLEKERVKNLSRSAGFVSGSDFSKGFKSIYWCNPIELRLEKTNLQPGSNNVMSIEDKNKYGSIIARYMSERETNDDITELNKWLDMNDHHIQLFNQLLDDTKTAWTRQWFDAAGIKHNKIRWTKDGGWYRYDLGRDEQIDFYKYAVLYGLGLIACYLIFAR